MPSNFQATIPAGVVQNSYAGLWKTPYGDVSPRLGFAWQMTEKPLLVLRGGFGVYFDGTPPTLPSRACTTTVFDAEISCREPPTGRPPCRVPMFPWCCHNSSYPIFVLRSAASPLPFTQGTDPNVKDGKTEEYNLNMQYALANDYLLAGGVRGNAIAASARPTRIQPVAAGQSAESGERRNHQLNQQCRRPAALPRCAQGSLFTGSIFIGNYNSLQTSITKRMQHGFQLQGSYVWSKNLDEVNGEGGTDTFELQLPTNNHTIRGIRRMAWRATTATQRVVAEFHLVGAEVCLVPTLPRHVFTDWQFSGIA